MDEYLITREPQTPDYRIERDSEGSKLKDVALSFGTGANSLLQMAGDFYGLATGDMDNTASRQARENIENLQRQKSPELQQAEQGRRDAIDAESDELGKALTYIRLTATDPLLLSTAIGEQLPSLVGTGGVGVVAKKGAEKLLLKTAANQAAKSLAAKKAAQIGTGAAVAAGAGIGGTDVAAGLYDEAVQSLDSISDEQAMSIPEIAKIVDERDATIDEAKAAFALTLGRQAFAVAAPISVGAQMLPGGRTIERAFVGRQVAKPIGGALAGAIGEAASEAVEEGGGKIASNILARKFDPERPIARGVGEAVGQAALVGGIPGGAAGLIFARPDSTSRPVSEGETLAGMSGQPPMPAATKPSIAPQQEATLERSEDLTPEQFWATINVRQASLLGGKPDPEDVALVGEVAPLRTEADPDEVNRVLDEASVALNNWSSDNPNAPENITLIFDPEMLHNGFGVQGAFNPKDGSILINTAFVTPENVGTIVNHEWAHATLATDEGRQALADFASREIPQEELDALAARYGTQDRIAILEEWIAGNQEKAPGVVSRIVTQIREWLSGFGIVDLTDAEVADIMLRTLREQAENRIQPDTYGTMQPTEGDRFSLSSELTPTEENLIRTADETSEPTRSTSKSRFYVTSDERGRDFADAIARAAQDHPRGAAVEVKPTEFYSDPENALFLSEDGLAGAVVKSDGDLVSVFKHPASKTRMKELLADASEQATKLDAFDIDSYLPQLYSNFGFRPVARVAFNDEYAPPGWNFEDMGRPDVVLMVKDRDNVLGLPDATLYTDEVREQVPLVSYDEAVRLQQGAIDRLSEKPAFDPKSPDIRYSLTSNAIGARALEDAETMTFKNWATASKYLGDLLKKEFPGGLDGQSPETLSRLADLMDRDLSLALTMPENADAIGWYNREMKTVFDILRSPELDYQLDDPVNRGVFNAILAITSNGQKVIPQFLKTAELYNGWRKTGLIPPVGKWGGERNRAIKGHVKFLNEMLRFAGPSGTVDYLTSEQTLGDHLNNLYGMVAAANGLPETATGDAKKKALKKYLKVTMPSGELVDYNTVGAAVFGPKLGGGFFANLYGKFDRLTMDRWFMRTFHRLTGRLGEQRPQMVADTLKEARDEAGDVLPEDVSDEEILQEINTTGKQAYKNYREIKKRLKDNPDDTEAESLDLMRRLYNRYVKSKSGLFDAPDNGTHRKFIRGVVDRVQKLRAERGDPPIDTSDIQAILWYLEKDIWNRLRKDMSPDVVDDADAQNDADDGDTEDTAGRVSYSDGARELYRRKVKKDYVAPNEAQPATGG